MPPEIQIARFPNFHFSAYAEKIFHFLTKMVHYLDCFAKKFRLGQRLGMFMGFCFLFVCFGIRSGTCLWFLKLQRWAHLIESDPVKG